MLLDSRDINILRLAGRYRWLPYEQLNQPPFSGLLREIELLIKTGHLGLSQKKRYLKLSQQGYDTLSKNGYTYDPGSKRAFAGSSALRRRLEASSIMLTALRAGIDVFGDNVETLTHPPSFYPAFDLRDGEMNLMNAASCAGFGNWGGKGYILQYISPQNSGMYLTNELGHLHSFSSLFDPRLKAPLGMIFAGPSYSLISDLLHGKDKSARHGKSGFVDYREVYQKSDMPIHLLSCDETGAMQLTLMSQPDYNLKIARAAFGDMWHPPEETIPEADGCIDGNPLVIAADMDVRRVLRVRALARQLGKTEVMIAALQGQVEDFYFDAIPKDELRALLIIEQHILDDAFDGNLSLRPVDDIGAGLEGGVFHA